MVSESRAPMWRRLPRDRDALLHAPAWRLAALIRSGEVSPVEVVDAHIARVEAVNPALNALIAERFDDARREARAAEARVRHAADPADLPPLLGVPCTIKEFLGVRGMSWTAGLWARRDRRADVDAAVVTRLRDAGAIVLGISNVPEGGMWMETYNPIYGRTSNPWDLTRTPGGSSGGEAALIAAAASPFGLGSDIAGSIRIPAGMCGIVGHKPSERVVPNTGHWPDDNRGEADRMLCIGPLGRCVRDVEGLLEVIAEPHRLAPREPALDAGDLRGVRVIPLLAMGRVRIAPVMRAAVEKSARALAERGAEIVELDAATWKRLFGKSLGTWLRGLSEAGGSGHPERAGEAGESKGHSFSDIVSGGERIALLPELIRILRGKPRYAAATLGLVALERFSRPLEKHTLGRAPSVAEIQAGIDEVLGPRGVILHPPYSRTAPRHFRPLLTPFDAVCTALFSVTGMPATVVPVGFDERHLPVGVQVIGRRGADRLTLAAARALEDAFGGWVPAPL